MPHRRGTVPAEARRRGSTCSIGATEGNVRFNVSDLTDAGITTYRVYGGMQRWEAQDDDGVYGSPMIAEIKANPSVVNWSRWDSVRRAHGRRHQAGADVAQRRQQPQPPWAQQLNPPTTQADRNEWWEHVFATVYWLDVRNDCCVTDFEVHNEPNNSGQDWGGTEADYFELVRRTKDAIDHVFRTYPPGWAYHVYAPVTTGGSSWPNDALQRIPDSFDSVDIHDYNSDITGYVEQVHGWMNASGHGAYPPA